MVNSCVTCIWARRLDSDGRNSADGTRVCIRTIEEEEDPVTGASVWKWNEAHTCSMNRDVGPCNHEGVYWEQVTFGGIT